MGAQFVPPMVFFQHRKTCAIWDLPAHISTVVTCYELKQLLSRGQQTLVISVDHADVIQHTWFVTVTLMKEKWELLCRIYLMKGACYKSVNLPAVP